MSEAALAALEAAFAPHGLQVERVTNRRLFEATLARTTAADAFDDNVHWATGEITATDVRGAVHNCCCDGGTADVVHVILLDPQGARSAVAWLRRRGWHSMALLGAVAMRATPAEAAADVAAFLCMGGAGVVRQVRRR